MGRGTVAEKKQAGTPEGRLLKINLYFVSGMLYFLVCSLFENLFDTVWAYGLIKEMRL